MARFLQLVPGNVYPDTAAIERNLAALETFAQPATELPRLCLWEPALGLANIYAAERKPRKAIEWVLKAFAALGYVIEGGSVPRTSSAPLVVKKWGVMERDLVGGWVTLFRAYRLVAPDLAPAARAYAKIFYKICVGEDETFEETFAKKLA